MASRMAMGVVPTSEPAMMSFLRFSQVDRRIRLANPGGNYDCCVSLDVR
jgi:hypothetical protein